MKEFQNNPKKKVAGRGNGASLVAFQKFLSTNKNPNVSYEPGVTRLTLEEVSKHNTPNDCWTVYKGVVYNISPFLKYHPGGLDEALKAAGRDCTSLYDKYHPWVNADAVLGNLRLGKLEASLSVTTHGRAVSEQNSDYGESSRVIIKEKRLENINEIGIDTSPDREQAAVTTRDLLHSPIGPFRAFQTVFQLKEHNN
jgi:cytochrome b involved in lipid metabolism